MKYIPGPPTIDHNNGDLQQPVKERLYCKGIAAQIMIHENAALLFKADPEFNFFQVPSEKVVIGIVWIPRGAEIAVALWTRHAFDSFFAQVRDGHKFFQTVMVDKPQATKIFEKEK
jgi:hypothetical protein